MDHTQRYSRQARFPGVGEAGQSAIQASKVAVVGCGALGTVTANGLVRAGVGLVRIIDRDFVELSNLQRQLIFDEDDVASLTRKRSRPPASSDKSIRKSPSKRMFVISTKPMLMICCTMLM